MGICRLIFKAQSVIKSFPADPTRSASVCLSSSAPTLLTLPCRDHPNEAERDNNSVVRDASLLLSTSGVFHSICVINWCPADGGQVQILLIVFGDRNADSRCFVKINKCSVYYLLSQTETRWYFSALGIDSKELEFPGSDAPWIHGFPHLR